MAEPETEPNASKSKRRPIVRLGIFLISHSFFFSLVLSTAAVLALLLLPVLAKNTYISENSLMPGSVAPVLSDEDVAEANRLIDDLTALNSKPVGSAIFKRPRNANRYARKLLDVLTSMGVPLVEQPKVVQKLLPVLAAAVSTNSIDVVVFDTTLIYPRSRSRDGDGDGNIRSRDGNIYPQSGDGDGHVPQHVAPPKLIPATTSSIQGLEPVTLDDNTVIKETPECPICLKDFAAAASVGNITALPCTHHFHVHCIVQWMEISHLCPLCRYAMPVEDDQSN